MSDTTIDHPDAPPDEAEYQADLERLRDLRDLCGMFSEGDPFSGIFYGTTRAEARLRLEMGIEEFAALAGDIAATFAPVHRRIEAALVRNALKAAA